jgi:uncharacterized protein (TIGR02246 family)
MVAACAQPEAAPDMAAIEQAIQAVRDQEIAGFNSGNIDQTLAVVTADGYLMPPNEPAKVGHDAARAWAQALFEQFTANVRYTGTNITVAGDYVIERYTAELTITPKAGGAAMTEAIKGIHIYQRQADGSWKIVQDVWNSDAPPPAAPPTTTTGQ